MTLESIFQNSIFQNSSGTKSIHSDFKKVTVRQLAIHNSGIDSPLDVNIVNCI